MTFSLRSTACWNRYDALGDLPLRKAALDRLDHAAHPVDLRRSTRSAPSSMSLRQLLDEIRPAERIDDVRRRRSRAR